MTDLWPASTIGWAALWTLTQHLLIGLALLTERKRRRGILVCVSEPQCWQDWALPAASKSTLNKESYTATLVLQASRYQKHHRRNELSILKLKHFKALNVPFFHSYMSSSHTHALTGYPLSHVEGGFFGGVGGAWILATGSALPHPCSLHPSLPSAPSIFCMGGAFPLWCHFLFAKRKHEYS